MPINTTNRSINHQITHKEQTSNFSHIRTYAPASRRISTNSSFYIENYYLGTPQPSTKTKASFSQAWRKARDKERIRVATGKRKAKTPFKKNWQHRKEKETAQQLLTKWGEYGERLGHHYKKYYDYIIDLDFWHEGTPRAIGEAWKQGFIKIMNFYNVKWEETSNGNAHVNLLLEEETSNGNITHIDKYGTKRTAGSILGKGRQARATHKREQGKGKWAIKAKNIKEVIKIFKLFYFDISIKEKQQQIIKGKHPNNTNIYQLEKNTQKTSKLLSKEKKEYQPLEENTQILIKEAIIGKRQQLPVRRNKPIYKQWYQRQKKGWQYFLIDTDYQNYTSDIIERLPEGSIRTFILNQGEKHQFFKQLWTEP